MAEEFKYDLYGTDTPFELTWEDLNPGTEIIDVYGEGILVDFGMWFDVQEKFGITISEDCDWYINMNATYEPEKDSLAVEYEIVGDPDADGKWYSYKPTENEEKMMKDLIHEIVMDHEKMTPLEFCQAQREDEAQEMEEEL